LSCLLSREYTGEDFRSESLSQEALRMGEASCQSRLCEIRQDGEGAPQAG